VPASAEKRSDARNAISDVPASRCGFEVTKVLHGLKATSGLDFAIIDYALGMILTGSLVYLLGCLFEEAPEPAFVRSPRHQ
jgi:hypothetical protein